MPKYQDVPATTQLPARSGKAPAAKPEEIAITTTIPAPLRRRLTLALAVHDVKLKDAIAQAVEGWLETHPPVLDE